MKHWSTFQKNLMILIGMYVFLVAMTFGLRTIYLTVELTYASARIIQAVFYVVLGGLTILAMKLSDYSFLEFGFIFRWIPYQLLVGLGIAAAFTLIGVFATGGYTIPSDWGYLIPSQLLAGIVEEMFWRGLMLKVTTEMMGNKYAAAAVNAVMFGMWHFVLTMSFVYVIVATVIGLIFAFARVRFEEHLGLPGLAFAHFLMNVF